MRRLIFILLAIAAAPLMAAEPDLLARIGAQAERHAVVRAEFVQQKQMAALKRPLVTSGHVVFSHRDGVLWQIESPYRAGYALGENSVVEIAGDGTRRERNLRDVPGLAQVATIFRAMLGANEKALRETFDVEARGDVERWQIELKPRQEQLARFVSRFSLAGGRFVESIRIEEAGGDTTLIRFRNTQAGEAASAAELVAFGKANPKP